MTQVISGRAGLVGWHLRAVLHSTGATWHDVDLRQPDVQLGEVDSIDRAVHVAGITRGTTEDLHEGNIALARRFVDAIDATGAVPRRVVHAGSVQAFRDTPYGLGKAGASAVLADAAERWGAEFLDLPIENVFGEHGAPDHNTVTATFCHRRARGLPIPVDSDAERVFVHAQHVADALLGTISPARLAELGTVMTIPALAARLDELAAVYDLGEVPDLSSPFDRDLFNTYRAAVFDVRPVHPLHAAQDHRGAFTELVRVHGGTGQTGISTTKPGVTRGDHFHRRKVERFVVVAGRARITLRRVLSDDRRHFDVDGDHPVAIDMPTLWSHAITNTGDEPLVTAFWTNDLFDPTAPDTHQDRA
ncbi:MAG: capsular biosynthesis protein [Leifsonia xyli]|nr:MAG: capsular biosynthesis protein [Leifsonia xyli]